MISRDGAVLAVAILCTAIVYSFDYGKQRTLDSLLTDCRPQQGEVLVSVIQQRTSLTCVFAPAEFVGYRAKRMRKAT